jgi:DNA-directed RNA polymerase specialized sigma24 family protein
MSSETNASHAPFDVECAEDATPPSAVRRRPTTRSLAIAPGSERGTRPMDTRKRDFTTTKWGLVLKAGEGSPRALKELCDAYYGPLQAYARRIVFDRERAEDVLQGFLATCVIEQNLISKADKERGRFRTLMCTALRNYARNVHRAENPDAPGGGPRRAEIDFDEIASNDPATDRLFNKAWARELLARALARLREQQWRQPVRGAQFEALLVWLDREADGAKILQVARALGKPEGAVRAQLFQLRNRFRDLVREEIAATVGSPDDVDAELRDLLAALRGDL